MMRSNWLRTADCKELVGDYLLPAAGPKVGHIRRKGTAGDRPGGLLHDIGMQYIPRHILDKRGKFTPRERQVVQQHVTHRFRELCHRNDISNGQLMMVYAHHECCDGRGYGTDRGKDYRSQGATTHLMESRGNRSRRHKRLPERMRCNAGLHVPAGGGHR